MGVIVDNPRYERLAQCLAAGMRQADIARELDFNEFYLSELKQADVIQRRLKELLEQQAQNLIQRDAVSVLERRKSRLQEIVDHAIEMPVSAGHRVSAAKELNLMEKVYAQGNAVVQPVLNVTYVFTQAPLTPQSAQSAQLPEPKGLPRAEPKGEIIEGGEAPENGSKEGENGT